MERCDTCCKTISTTFFELTTALTNLTHLDAKLKEENIQLAEAMSVMNSLIAGGIFLTAHGTLTGVRDIKVIDTTTDDLYDPPQA